MSKRRAKQIGLFLLYLCSMLCVSASLDKLLETFPAVLAYAIFGTAFVGLVIFFPDVIKDED